jgi:hypothetical protein
MGLVNVQITNNGLEDITLPPSWGEGQVIAPLATKTITMEPSRLQQLSREQEPDAVKALESLLAIDRSDLDVQVTLEDTGVAANTATTYANTLDRNPVVPGSVTVFIPADGGGFIEVVDNAGVLEEDGAPVGAITYSTGAISITKGDLTGTPASTTDPLLATYKSKLVKVAVAANAAVNSNLGQSIAEAADRT